MFTHRIYALENPHMFCKRMGLYGQTVWRTVYKRGIRCCILHSYKYQGSDMLFIVIVRISNNRYCVWIKGILFYLTICITLNSDHHAWWQALQGVPVCHESGSRCLLHCTAVDVRFLFVVSKEDDGSIFLMLQTHMMSNKHIFIKCRSCASQEEVTSSSWEIN
jgi:hypothetical protein